MKKRLLSVIMCFAMAAALIGCGNNTKDTGSKGGSVSKTSSAQAQTSASKASVTDNKTEAEPVEVEFWTISLRPKFDDFFNKLFMEKKRDYK